VLLNCVMSYIVEEYHLLGYDAVKMEAIRPSETSGTTQRTTRRHIPEDDTLHNHRCENLKSYIVHSYQRFRGICCIHLQGVIAQKTTL
jgi:hypothetical protein